LKRGDIWTVSGGDFLGKPRPAVVVRADAFGDGDSVTLCGFTTDSVEASFVRLEVVPTPENGLRENSWLMADKLASVRLSKVGRRIGRLGRADMARLNRALIVYLGLVESLRDYAGASK
jgi:mRNA interferase MazF